MSKPILETDDLAIGYRTRRHAPHLVAERLDLRLYPGELVCLLGPNGAGKSTLLRTLAGMQPPLRGQLRLAGTDLYRLSPQELARRLAVVLTDRVEVGNLSVRTLTALGRYPHTGWRGRLTLSDEAAIDRALTAVGIADFAPRLINELSDGERQKVMIARALAQEPQLLLLDEPTAFLDLPRRVELMGLLRRLARDGERAVLLSTHDLDLALRCADQLWLLQAEGSIQVGVPEELVLNGAFQHAFHGAGVTFDACTGVFVFQHPPMGRIDLVGHDLAAVWTRRALEREGFVVSGHEDPPATLRVAIHDQEGQTVWRLYHEDTYQDFPTLSQTLRGVKTHWFAARTEQ